MLDVALADSLNRGAVSKSYDFRRISGTIAQKLNTIGT